MKNPIIVATFILGSLIATAQSNTPKEVRTGLLPASHGKLCGYIDRSGKIRIPYKYEYAFPFYEGLAGVKLNGKWGFIDSLGKTVIPFAYEYVRHFQEGLAKVTAGKKVSFIDKKGKVAIRTDFAEFEVGEGFSDGFCNVSYSGAVFGYMDTSGKMALPFKYSEAGDFKDGLAAVTFYESYSIIDGNTSKKLPGYPDNYGKRLPNGASYLPNGQTTSGYINKMGELVLKGDYVTNAPFSEGMAAVTHGGLYGFIDNTGQVIVKPTYSMAGSFREGLALVRLDSKYGFINKRGELVIPNQFKYANDFSEGLAVVEVDGLKGFIDKTGVLVIPATYVRAYNFDNGVALVGAGNQLVLIDRKGRVVGNGIP